MTKLIEKYQMRRSKWMNRRSNLIRSEMWRCRERNGEWFLERGRNGEWFLERERKGRYTEEKIEKQRERSCRLLKTEREKGEKEGVKERAKTAHLTRRNINIILFSPSQLIWHVSNFKIQIRHLFNVISTYNLIVIFNIYIFYY